jgi:hypothetical protein
VAEDLVVNMHAERISRELGEAGLDNTQVLKIVLVLIDAIVVDEPLDVRMKVLDAVMKVLGMAPQPGSKPS